MNRRHLWSATFTGLAMVAAACGGSGGDDGDSASAADEQTPLVDATMSCLETAGFEVERGSTLPEEAQESLGIEDHLSIAGSDEFTGLGGITWYVGPDEAQEAHEAGGKVRTEDVARGVVGSATWDFAGTDDAAEAIEGCL